MKHEIDSEKHYHNLTKTIEGTAWILCDAIHTMAENGIVPDDETGHDLTSRLAQRLAEIFEVISECEEPEIIDFAADKMLETAGNQQEQLLQYLAHYMGDNPLYKRVYENYHDKG